MLLLIPLIMFTLICLTLTCLIFPGAPSPTSFQSGAELKTEIDLSDWGLKTINEIGFVSIGVQHVPGKKSIAIYGIFKQKPVAQSGTILKLTPKFEGDALLVANFSEGNTNRLGGYFNSFSKAPSSANVSIEMLPQGEQALALTFTREFSGFAGFWIHLFDFKAPQAQRVFFDASPFKYVTFSIRGFTGKESLTLQVADRTWEQKQDSLPIGELGDYLPEGRLTKQWQRAWIPLDLFPQRIDKTELASLVFQATRGAGKIFIQDLAFARIRDAAIPRPEISPVSERNIAKGMWLWETAKLLNDKPGQIQLLEFCRDQKITDLFLQLPYSAAFESGKWQISWDDAGLRSLLDSLNTAGIICHALDGHPRFALTPEHEKVKAILKKVIEFNSLGPESSRFQAVRYDIEPYILPQFGGVQKQSILLQYLELLNDLRPLISQAGMELGADIPFWYDTHNRHFQPAAEILGRPLNEWVLDVVDNVGIMDYRTRAYGADGTIAQAEDELRYAAEKGKKVFVGLETVTLPDETLLDFTGKQGPSLVRLSRIEGTRVLLEWISDGSQKGGNETKPSSRELFQTNRIEVPSSRITFQEKTRQEFDAVIEKTAREFSRYSSFYGFAIHSYESFRPWLEKRKK
jgi:hypothetical protein